MVWRKWGHCKKITVIRSPKKWPQQYLRDRDPLGAQGFPHPSKNCWGHFLRFLWVLTHDFWAIWARKTKNLVWAQKHPKRVCNPLGGPRSPLEAFLSDLPFFWNFEFFVLKCLKNAYFHRSQKVQNFEKVKNRDFERAITFCRKAHFR